MKCQQSCKHSVFNKATLGITPVKPKAHHSCCIATSACECAFVCMCVYLHGLNKHISVSVAVQASVRLRHTSLIEFWVCSVWSGNFLNRVFGEGC